MKRGARIFVGLDPESARAASWILIPSALVVSVSVLVAHFAATPGIQKLFDNLHWTVSYGAAAALAWLGVRNAEPAGATTRRWFAWALTLYWIGQLLWDVQVAIDWNPFPGPSDLGYLALGPLTGAGLVTFLRRSSSASEQRTAALDVLGLCVAVLAFTLALYLPRRGDVTWLQMGFMVAYPVGLSWAACLALITILALHLKPERGWLLLLLGLSINGAIWLEWNAATLDNTLTDGSWYNAVFSLAALTQGTGALLFRGEVSRSERWERFCEGLLRLLPLLSVALSATAVVLAYAIPDTPSSTRRAAFAGALVVTLFASLRQSLLLGDRERLMRTERELRLSQTKYRATLDLIPIPVQITRHPEGHLVEMNRAFTQHFGFSLEESRGRRPSELGLWVSLEDRDRFVNQLRATGHVTALETVWRGKDGKERPCLLTAALTELEDEPHCVFVIQDIEERKRAEAAVRQSEEKYRILVEQAVDGIFIADTQGRFTDVNPRGEEMLQIPRAELFGLGIADVVGSEELARIPDELALLRRGATAQAEWRMKRKDGSTFWAEVTSKLLPDGRVQGTVHDISERKLAEQALRASEERTQLVIATTLDAVINMDRSGRVTEWNAEAERIFGRRREEVLGCVLSELIVPPALRAAHRAGLARFLATSESPMLGKRVELSALRADGSEFPVELSIAAVRSGPELFFSAFLRDLTETKRVEEERRELESQLRQAQKMEAVGTLAAGIAHDFNNMLSAIRGNTELAALDLAPDHPARVSLDEIDRASTRATELVQQIVGFSKPRPRELQRVNLRDLVAEVVRLLRSTLPAGVELKGAGEGEPLVVLADATQVHQVLVNLCTNAWQAMESRPGKIAIRLEQVTLSHEAVLALAPGGYACIVVEDTGRGMTEDTQHRIFEPFFSTRPRGQGTGLGLSMAHSIVRAHQGTITVESTLGVGTTFRIYLPAAPGEVWSERPRETTRPRGAGGRKVLYVDDEDALVFLVTRQLRRRGYDVTGFTSAEAALSAITADTAGFDVLVTDYNMPRMSGIDLIRAVKAVRGDARFVLTSGYIHDEMRALALELKVEHLIYKPNNVDELCEAIDRVTLEIFQSPPPARAP